MAMKPALEQSLLPGHTLPLEASCNPPADRDFECQLNLDGKTIYFVVEDGLIGSTVVATHEYTVGELIAAWGEPTRYAQHPGAVDIYWGNRYVYVVTCSFRPESRIEFIASFVTELRASPWRGFTNLRSLQCSRNQPNQ